jgi:cell division protein FtsZ
MGSTTDLGGFTFDLPKNQSNVIKVIGVGGGGSNAINHMFKQGIKGVDFVICNTDAQALQNSPVPNKIQLGLNLTEGLGAGANPEIGQQSALESMEEIEKMLDANTKMVFITAGMGGGTGTGAAPVIAQMAKEKDILTVGIVTIPFQFEGKVRFEQAMRGVDSLRAQVDSLIVINNNKLREVYGNLGFKAGFSKADEVLSTAARGIAEVITHHYLQNIDLKDAKTVLSNSGTAIMGSSVCTGENRAKEAIVTALDSPLLNDNKITGAKNVLLLIVSGASEITIDEISEINEYIQDQAGYSANIIMGVGEDETLGDAVSITVIATGFNAEQQKEIVNQEPTKVIHVLDDEQKTQISLSPDAPLSPKMQREIPAVNENNKIVFHLEVEDEDEIPTATVKKTTFESVMIPTTEHIKNIPVTYQIVKPNAEVLFQNTPEISEMTVNNAEFIIVKKTSVVNEPAFQETVKEEKQIPIELYSQEITFERVVAEPEKVVRFTLEDKETEAPKPVSTPSLFAEPIAANNESDEPEMKLTIREVAPQNAVEVKTPIADINPYEMSIQESLKIVLI